MIVFVPYPNVQAQQIPAAGGTATPVKMADPAPHLRWFPSFLPDGRHYLYLAIDLISRLGTAVHVASLDSTETRELVPSTVSATYAEPGYLLFRRDAALVGAAIRRRDAADGGARRGRGRQRRLRAGGLPDLCVGQHWRARLQAARPGVASHVVRPDWPAAGRRGLPTAGQYNALCLSHDGTRLVYDLVDADRASTNHRSLVARHGQRRDHTADLRPVRGLLSGVRADRR